MQFLDNNRRILIELLSAAIRGKTTFRPSFNTGINWQKVFYEATKHQVLPLLYPLLVEIGDNIGLSKTLLEELRRNTLCQGFEQERYYIEIGKLLGQFSNEGIPLIVLKGIMLREMYPYPYLRTMGDIDLLVKSSGMEVAGRVLVEAGYKIYSDKGKHILYSHKYLPSIELHRSMVPEGYFGNNAHFETDVWNRAVTVNVSGIKVLSLCAQDNVLYLLMHMASHIINSGFGLRQLCDFVLFIEANCTKIDWTEFFNGAALCGLGTFLEILLQVCHIMFHLDIPEIYIDGESQNISLIRSFILDIYDGGIFGNNNYTRKTANRMLYYNSGTKAIGLWKKIQYYLRFILPSLDKLDTRYNYVRKHHFLLPVAWFHRILYCFIRKDIDFSEKTTIFATNAIAKIYKERSVLLRQLGLLD